MLVVAAVLRLPTLGTWSVWIDEAFTLHDARHDAPPYLLSYVVTQAAVAVAGDGEWALRIAPCLAGLATVALLLGARSAPGTDPRTPVLAAAVLAVLPWHVFMSQNARHYALQAFCMLVAFLAADGRLAAGRPRPLVAGLGLAAALGCHPTAVFFVPGLVLVGLRRLRGRARALAASGAAVLAALAVAVYLPLHAGYAASKGATSTLQLAASYGFLASPALLLCALAAATARPRPVAELALLVPTAAVFLAASLPLFVTGYHAFASVPVLVLLAAHGMLHAARARAVLVVLLTLAIAYGLWLYHASHGLRPRWREASAWAAAARADGCRLFATQAPPLAYYLGDRSDLRLPDAVGWLQPWTLADLEQALHEGPVAVLVAEDDLQPFSPAERVVLRELLRQLPVERTFPAAYGPKDLTLHARRSRS